MLSWAEYWIELQLLPPAWKMLRPCVAVGLALCVMGEFTRKLAMFTAARSFSHIIQTEEKGRPRPLQ